MNIKTFVALFAVIFAAEIGHGIIAPLMPIYAKTMGASGLWLGIIFSSYALSKLIFTPIAGRLSDVRDRKRFIAVGLLAYTIISLFYTWADSILALTLVRLLHGLATCLIVPIALAYVSDLTPKGKEGTYINLFSMSQFLGLGFGPLLAGTLTQYFFMDAAFYAMTGVCGLSLFLLLRFVPPVETLVKKEGEVAPLKTVIRDNRVKATSIYRFTRAVWRQAIIAFLPLLAVSTLQMNVASIGLVLSIYLLVDGAAQGLAGPLVDRTNKIALIAIGSIIGSIPLLLIPYAPTGALLLAILILVGLLDAVARGSALAINVEVGKQYKATGTIMGIFISAASLGHVIGPVALGYTMDLVSLNAVFVICGINGILGGLIAIYYLVKK